MGVNHERGFFTAAKLFVLGPDLFQKDTRLSVQNVEQQCTFFVALTCFNRFNQQPLIVALSEFHCSEWKYLAQVSPLETVLFEKFYCFMEIHGFPRRRSAFAWF